MDDEVLVFNGRFQPFHLGHFHVVKYLLESTSRDIVIGIVNPDPSDQSEDAQSFHRFALANNPLNYWDRYISIRNVLSELDDARVIAIVPMPRPSIDFDRCKRFLPEDVRLRLVVCLRYGDDMESWKNARYDSLNIATLKVPLDQIPESVQPISGELIRSLMVLKMDLWKKLVPEPVAKYLQCDHVYSKCVKSISIEDARDTIESLSYRLPKLDWSVELLGQAANIGITPRETRMANKDYLGAIAESVFGMFPPAKGLLRLRDDELRQEKEQQLIAEIQRQNVRTIAEIRAILKGPDYAPLRLGVNWMDATYERVLLEATRKPDGRVLGLEIQKEIRRVGFTEESFVKSITDLYSATQEDFWILLQHNGFDVSYLTGTSFRSKIRKFIQLMATRDIQARARILHAIHKEHSEVPVFRMAAEIANSIARRSAST